MTPVSFRCIIHLLVCVIERSGSITPLSISAFKAQYRYSNRIKGFHKESSASSIRISFGARCESYQARVDRRNCVEIMLPGSLVNTGQWGDNGVSCIKEMDRF